MEEFSAAEEMQFVWNLGHRMESSILGSVAVVVVTQALGYFRARRARFLWAGLTLVAGLFLLHQMLLHHKLDKIAITGNLIMADPYQRQHFLVAVLFIRCSWSRSIPLTLNIQRKAVAICLASGLSDDCGVVYHSYSKLQSRSC